MKSRVFLMVMGLMLVLFCYSSAQVPQMINYQGKLTSPAGAPITDTLQIVFTIYADEAGTTPLWTETQPTVEILKGVFNVLLGSVNPISYSVFDGTTRYLGVSVGGDPEITPRKPMVSVAYAMRAGSGGGGSDNDWTYRITDSADTTLVTGGAWGIARYGNVLFGNADSTHVNLGVACTTGTSGQNKKYCTVAGGVSNIARGYAATVGGGMGNIAGSGTSTVGGGFLNQSTVDDATVGGGSYNTASGGIATVGGGSNNTASGDHATIGGGSRNSASGSVATVGGGDNHTASGYAATVGGGLNNVANNHCTTVGGGESGTASGQYATVAGGRYNTASGNYSLAAGRRAKANHAGNFVWADSTNADFASTGGNQFLIRASGGVGIGTNSPAQQLDVNGTVQMTGFKMPTGAGAGNVLTSDASGVGTWQAAGGTIGGSGTANYIPKFTGSTTIGNSVMYETGSNIGIGTTSPNEQLEITGNLRLPATTATVGIIKVVTDRFIHNYGTSNTFVGENAGNLTMTGERNTANGFEALYSNTSGDDNTANGYRALYSNTTGYYNTANGYVALMQNTTGSYNTANGHEALFSNGLGSWNTAIGVGALYSNTIANSNTANGYQALFSNTTGDFNTAIGYRALFSNNTGYSNTANGYRALYSNTTGEQNTANGFKALYSNTTGNFNTALGCSADVSADNLTNATAIGAHATVAISNALVLGGTGANAVKVGIGTTSPAQTLDVVGTAQMTGFKMITGASAGEVLTTDAAGVGTWQAAGGTIGGSGTTNYLPKFTASTTLGNSVMYETSSKIGIGTTSPNSLLEVYGTDAELTLNTTSSYAGIEIRESGTSKWTVGWNSGSQYFYFYSAKGSPGTKMMIHDSTGNVGIGTTAPAYKLDVNGDINVSGSYNVKKGGTNYTHPDYVFEPDYKLMPLDELRKYVSEKKALPGVITADEVKKNEGFKMDELLVQMLEKMEEQTLYILQLEERIAELEKKGQQK